MSKLHKRLDKLTNGPVDRSRAWINLNGLIPPPPDWQGEVLNLHMHIPYSEYFTPGRGDA